MKILAFTYSWCKRNHQLEIELCCTLAKNDFFGFVLKLSPCRENVKIEIAKDKYEDASRLNDASLVQRKVYRPSLDKLPAQEKAEETIVLRSQGFSFNKNLCIICQVRSRLLHDLEFIATGQKMLFVAEKHDDKGAFYRHMNLIRSSNDAVAAPSMMLGSSKTTRYDNW